MRRVSLCMRTTNVSRSQQEVWEWKDQAYQEVEGLDLSSALRKRLLDSMGKAKRLGVGSRRPVTK